MGQDRGGERCDRAHAPSDVRGRRGRDTDAASPDPDLLARGGVRKLQPVRRTRPDCPGRATGLCALDFERAVPGRRSEPALYRFDADTERAPPAHAGAAGITTPPAGSGTQAARTDARPARFSRARRALAGSACADRAPLAFPA